jgi:hypothetical protein
MMNVILKNSVSLVEISPQQATYLIKRYASSHPGMFNDDDDDFKNEVTKRVSLDGQSKGVIYMSPEQQALEASTAMIDAANAFMQSQMQSQKSGATTQP